METNATHYTFPSSIRDIVACFLALRLEVDLQRRLDARGIDVAWPDLMRDLAQVQAVTVTLDGASPGDRSGRLRPAWCR